MKKRVGQKKWLAPSEEQYRPRGRRVVVCEACSAVRTTTELTGIYFRMFFVGG